VSNPELVTALNLDQWSDSLAAQTTLPILVRRLILATATVTEISMRAREGSLLPGWDGLVRCDAADAHVPLGTSGWELGTSKDPRRKAQDDIGGGGVTVDLNRTDDLEAGLLESDRSTATSGEEVSNRGTSGHAAPRFPGCRAAQCKTSARSQNRPRRGPRSTTGRGKSWYLFIYVDTLLRWRRPSNPATSVASTRSTGFTSNTPSVYTCRLTKLDHRCLREGSCRARM
jgi:hypothetical protein